MDVRRLAVANGPNIFQMLVVDGIGNMYGTIQMAVAVYCSREGIVL